MIGKEIGIYRIVQKLGEGGMGVVYKAVDMNLDRTVALKLLGAEVAGQPQLVERFRSEARVQAGLSHPNLATLFTFLVWEGTPIMVMEFIEGETFQQIIARRGPIPSQEAVPMFQQALRGMGAAHHRGIVHRDIKPANIMLNDQGIVKVMDFGIAKVLGVTGVTRTNMQMGTSWYMSPEQVLGQPVDARSDIYSLGVTFYEMLSGETPFRGDSDFAIQMAHVQQAPEAPTVYYPHIPPHVVAAAMKSLAKKPEDRFASVEEFVAALNNTAYVPTPPSRITTPLPIGPPEQQRFTLPPPPPYTPVQPPRTSGNPAMKWGVLAAGLVLLAVIAGGLIYTYQARLKRQQEERNRIALQPPPVKPAETVVQSQPEIPKETTPETAPDLATLVPPVTTSPAPSAKAPAVVSPPPPRLPDVKPDVRQEAEPVLSPEEIAAATQKLAGVWQGSYTCGQGPTAASVLITPKPASISAVMSFTVPNTPTPGTFLMSGTFNARTNQLQLKFVRWGLHPPQYEPADLSGTVNLQQGIITGTVIAPGCTTFSIHHR